MTDLFHTAVGPRSVQMRVAMVFLPRPDCRVGLALVSFPCSSPGFHSHFEESRIEDSVHLGIRDVLGLHSTKRALSRPKPAVPSHGSQSPGWGDDTRN